MGVHLVELHGNVALLPLVPPSSPIALYRFLSELPNFKSPGPSACGLLFGAVFCYD